MSEYVQAYCAFFNSFKQYIPKLELFNGSNINKDTKLVVFSGGEDIASSFYDKSNTPLYYRDRIEKQALEICLDLNIKVLGVCRGHQLINAYLGARFIEDIKTELKAHHPNTHPIETVKDSVIDMFFYDGVNSLHHQGVYNAGEGLTITSMYSGVVESTENKHIITTQFHPEWMDNPHFFSWLLNWSNKED